jgi:hypothetical protein
MVLFTTRGSTQPAETELEGKIREFVRRDFGALRHQERDSRQPRAEDGPRRRPQESDPAAGNAGSLLQRVSEASLKEVDHLIVELQTRREKLLSERARLQREIIEFAKMSQSTMQSTKIIAESLKYWNKIPDPLGTKPPVENTDYKERRESEGEAFIRPVEGIATQQLTKATPDVPDNLTAEPSIPNSELAHIAP